VTKGKQRKDFFTVPEFEKWLEKTPDARKWTSKYYKVLQRVHECRPILMVLS
jgi:DNA topoisomerase II